MAEAKHQVFTGSFTEAAPVFENNSSLSLDSSTIVTENGLGVPRRTPEFADERCDGHASSVRLGLEFAALPHQAVRQAPGQLPTPMHPGSGA